MDLFNYKDNCRLCLKTHTEFMKNMFSHSVEGYQDTLVQNIFTLFKVELKAHKDYPQFICRKCLTEVENILLFKEDLQRNQNFLLDLFRAAYPNHVEKNLDTLSYSKRTGTKCKSVAVNTDLGLDLDNLGDSEYVRVPVHFLKQFSPVVRLEQSELGACINRHEIKEEIDPNDILNNDKRNTVNSCKYCSKVFGSHALVNTHCKEVHKLEEQKKTNGTRKRIPIGTHPPLAKKVKANQDALANLSEVHIEQDTLPQIDLQDNNNADIKEDSRESPSSQQVNKILSSERNFQKKQALFLQNFNLIAKQEAARLKSKQGPSKMPKRLNFKKNMMLNKSVVKPLKSKSKIVGKPLSGLGRGQPKKINKDILNRSLQFLKRYGWRKLQSSSRRGTPVYTDKINLFKQSNEPTKSISKKVLKTSVKSSVKGNSHFSHKDESAKVKIESCETSRNLDNFNQFHDLTLPGIKVERSNSIKSTEKSSLVKLGTANQSNRPSNSSLKGKHNQKKSTSSSSASSKNSSKTAFSKYIDNVNTKLELDVKNEPLSPLDSDKTKVSRVISLNSSYNKSENIISTKRAVGGKAILDKKNVNHRLSTRHDSWKDSNQGPRKSETKFMETPTSQKKSEQILNQPTQSSHKKPHINLMESGLKPKHFHSGNVDFLLPTSELEVKRELRIELEENGSPIKHNGYNGSSDDFEFKTRNDELDTNKTLAIRKLPRKRGRPRKLDYSKVKKRSGRLRNKNKLLLINSNCNFLKKEDFSTSMTLSESKDDKSAVAGKIEHRRKGRPRKNMIISYPSTTTSSASRDFANESKLPLLDVTPPQLGCKPFYSKSEDLSALQELNDRYEQGDNISLRIKLRKTTCCESLNSLKYDTQELDENFQSKAEMIDQNTNSLFNNVPDYNKQVGNPENKKITPEKVINLDLEDAEVRMLVLRSDIEDTDFDNEDISEYRMFKNGSLNLNRNLRSESDSTLQQKQINRSQTLPLENVELKGFDVGLIKKDFTNVLTSNQRHSISSVNLATTSVKRRGRPPTKFFPSVYVGKRSKSIAALPKSIFNNITAGLSQKTHTMRSRSKSQAQAHEKYLFNAVKKRNVSKRISTVKEESCSPIEHQKQSQEKHKYGSNNKHLMPNRIGPKNGLNHVTKNVLGSSSMGRMPSQDNKLNTKK